jgi:polyisoprenoid-binding protein YceI
MKKTILILMIFLTGAISLQAQRYVTKNGFIKFYSDAPLEKIEAANRQVNAAIDIKTGDFVFKVLMKSFVFPKALMQEHFNENYIESDKFPEAKFIGKVTNLKEIDFSKDGIYPALVEGKLTIHGETKDIQAKGTFEIKQDKLDGNAKFNIVVADYKIKIPNTVVNNIAKTVEITVDITMDKLNK